MKRHGQLVFAVLVLMLLLALSFFYGLRRNRKTVQTQTAGASHAGAAYAGAEACKACHQSEYQAWVGSDHQLAMQEATASTVEGDFHDAKFTYFGVISRFSPGTENISSRPMAGTASFMTTRSNTLLESIRSSNT